MPKSDPSGWLVLDKPAGMTSHDVIARLRRAAHYRRFGHSGTLDPDATGVLVVAAGAATRLIRYLPERKVYRALVRLGVTTDTQDAGGKITGTRPVKLTQKEIIDALSAFQGRHHQRPPMVSAVHYQGRRLYELARAGQDVPDRAAREVVIYNIQLLDIALPDLTLQVACSGGTYIRTLAHDLGDRLDCGAHLLALRRLQANGLDIEQARNLEELLLQKDQILEQLLPPHVPLAHVPALHLDDDAIRRLQQGQRLRGQAEDTAGPYCVFSSQDGQLKAIAACRDGLLIPETVLPPLQTGETCPNIIREE